MVLFFHCSLYPFILTLLVLKQAPLARGWQALTLFDGNKLILNAEWMARMFFFFSFSCSAYMSRRTCRSMSRWPVNSQLHPTRSLLQATCERGFTAMEESHQKVIDELQRKHQRELENLQEEKERLLAEETAATIAGKYLVDKFLTEYVFQKNIPVILVPQLFVKIFFVFCYLSYWSNEQRSPDRAGEGAG